MGEQPIHVRYAALKCAVCNGLIENVEVVTIGRKLGFPEDIKLVHEACADNAFRVLQYGPEKISQ